MHFVGQSLNQEAVWYLHKLHMRMAYFEAEDILYLTIAGGPEAQSVELSPDVTVEMDAQRQILGVEILNASRFLHDSMLEYWLHEGPEDEEGDAELLAEALEMLKTYETDRSGWKSLEDFETELAKE